MTSTQAEAVPGGRFKESTVEANGVEARYWESGEGEPLVWIHGAGGPSFSHALDLLAASSRVIILELPGFGGSAPLDSVEDASSMASATAAIIRALGLKRAHVWGTSMGGIVATYLALEHPQLVESLTLEAPGSFRAGAPDPSQLSPEDIVRAFNSHPERVSYREMSPPDPDQWALVMKVMGADHDEGLEPRLGEIGCATLAFWGIDDGIISPEWGRLYKTLVPHCAYVLVYDAAHDVQGDRPEACAELVGDFVERSLNFVINDRDGRINP